ncbi:MAG: tRNA pseudouridine(38-40) synthase TruA [Bdellovibrionales bacterium]|nr:tRNA pseudouridine(38-40) synthase TruA [Bdellovibrionales bacterium]
MEKQKKSRRSGKKYNRTIALEIQYEGTRYCGWQRQERQSSVQQCLEEAIQKVANEEIVCFASGRTDAGVHARKQLVSFSLESCGARSSAFLTGVNQFLPEDIRVLVAQEVDVDFNAISQTYSKSYRFFLRSQARSEVFFRNYVWNVRDALDRKLMERASQIFIGKHDFSCFQTHKTERNNHVRTLERIDFGDCGDYFYIELQADGFLRHMVRALVGTLVDIGRAKMSILDCMNMIESRDRGFAGQTAPAHGLFLWDIFYHLEVKQNTSSGDTI